MAAALGSMFGRMSLAAGSRVPRAPRAGGVAAAVPRVGSVGVWATQNKEKRARQNETRRMYHKMRRSEMATRIKKVLVLSAELKSSDCSQDDLKPLDTLINEAYKVLDKGVKTHTIKKNTAARRKSRLAKAKKSIEIEKGWYLPA